MAKGENAGYNRIVRKIFFDKYVEGIESFPFRREDILEARDLVAPELQRLNAGDVKYHFTYRSPYPQEIRDTEPLGKKWAIFGAGKSKYEFRQVSRARILPNPDLVVVLIPDATPEIIRSYTMNDEQALLAVVRYNRLIDIFLGISAYSLQNHLRTAVKGVGQIEIDELYVGVDKRGQHYMIPVQAKAGKDEIGVVQVTQDIMFVEQKFPGMRCRAIATQFMADKTVAMFSLLLQEGEVRIEDERHYRLVPHDRITRADVTNYDP